MVFSYTSYGLVICVKLIDRAKLLGQILPSSVCCHAGPKWEDLSGKLLLNRDVSIFSVKTHKLLTCQLGCKSSGSAETSVLWESLYRRDHSGLPFYLRRVKLGISRVLYAAAFRRCLT